MKKKILVALLAMSLTATMAVGAMAAADASASSSEASSSATETSSAASSSEATSSTAETSSAASSSAATSSTAETSSAATSSATDTSSASSTVETTTVAAVVETPASVGSASTVSKTPSAIDYVTVAAVKNAIKAAENEGNTKAVANIIFRNPLEFGRKELLNIKKAARTASEGSSVQVTPVVCADTIANGNVSARMYIDPALVNNDSNETIKTAIQTDYNTDCMKVQDHFRKFFSNKNLSVIRFDEMGDFGMEVVASVSVDLRNFDTTTLHLYNYNKATNEYTDITDTAKSFIDDNGYLHYTTTEGRYTIVTDSPLTAN